MDSEGSYSDFLASENLSETLLPLVSLIVFIVFFGIMLFLLLRSSFESTSTSTSVIQCAPGQCATNLFSGFKSCPVVDSVTVTVNPSESVCNSPFVCDNPVTPYALQSDGSTDINGVCEPFTKCSCLRYSQCPQYILSVFTSINGNPYESVSGQRITFPQESTYVNNTSGLSSSNPPIQFSNPSTTFCTAPVSWLPLASPGCNFVSNSNLNSMDLDDVLLCQGMVSGCSGLFGNPCLQGTLAAITNNPSSITQETLFNTQFGCVAGPPCPCGQLAIFDTNLGQIICNTISN